MALPRPSKTKSEQEFGTVFAPKFDSNGLVTAVTVDRASKVILMVAHMNEVAVQATLDTGYAHYWSRSRQTLWKKGETSGELQRVASLFTDCDQDAIVLEVDVEGNGSACHNGFQSCFYRVLKDQDGNTTLERIADPVADPDALYRKT